MKNKLIYSIALTFLIGLAVIAKPGKVVAQYYNQGSVTKSISIDKRVRDLSDTTFYDNIDSKVKTFYVGDNLEFIIDIENNGSDTINNLKVKDILPKNLSLTMFPGTYNNTDNTTEWIIDELKAGEKKSFMVRTKVIKEDDYCGVVTNTAQVGADGIGDQDTASFYIGCASIPKTGDPTVLINTLFGLGAVISAYGIRKFARGY
jgi:uncharacterized repeat protein (TIGR01451 family)